MSRIFVGLSVIAFVGLATGQSFAGDHKLSSAAQANAFRFERTATYGYDRKKSASGIKIIYVSSLSDGNRARIENALTPQKLATIRASIDGGVAAQLRAKGVNPNNVVEISRPFSGRTIYYVR
ncbi:hypothetical protein JJB09_13990 [Rhizobium sp. KVB221]|uniref:DUF4148 domain-containing protein n=1 Tax=Rhizobium setariae TaxID=2801340 RepID=A0A936YQX6_9HYPH|nr:hypothetical protein [Rhizobium setariae]MBL0373142.1 hypothetical protein [Rhizobium setariae]